MQVHGKQSRLLLCAGLGMAASMLCQHYDLPAEECNDLVSLLHFVCTLLLCDAWPLTQCSCAVVWSICACDGAVSGLGHPNRLHLPAVQVRKAELGISAYLATVKQASNVSVH